VLLPDGSPAAGVEVALCTANVGVMLSGTAFEPGAFGHASRSQGNDYRRKTDEHGSFSFDPKPGAHTLVAVGSPGLGLVRCFDFSKPLVIRLSRGDASREACARETVNGRIERWNGTGLAT